MSDKRIRIVVLNLNHAELTLNCISSIIKQTYDPMDIVVIDNNSTPEELKKLCSLLPRKVCLIQATSNLGYAAGNNLGAKAKIGTPPSTYTMFINNDVKIPDSNLCKRLVQALENDSLRVACSPLVDTTGSGLPPEEQLQVRRIPDFITVLTSGSWWLRRLPWFKQLWKWYTYQEERPYKYWEEVDCESINGSCFIIRNDFLEIIGFLDEGTFLYFEEIILGKQIKDQGKRACLVTSAVVNHFQGETSKQRLGNIRIKMTKEMVRSEIYYCRKYLKVQAILIMLLVMVRIIDNSTKFVYQRFRGLFI